MSKGFGDMNEVDLLHDVVHCLERLLELTEGNHEVLSALFQSKLLSNPFAPLGGATEPCYQFVVVVSVEPFTNDVSDPRNPQHQRSLADVSNVVEFALQFGLEQRAGTYVRKTDLKIIKAEVK